LDKKVDEAFHAPSAFFIRSPSGFERFGLACRLGRRSGSAGSSTGRPRPLVDAENDRKSVKKDVISGFLCKKWLMLTEHCAYRLLQNPKAKDAQARTGEPISRSGSIFPKEEYVRKEGYEARYGELLSQNKLLFTLDLIKERLSLSYTREDEVLMADDISWIMDTCSASGNSHLQWFGRLLSNHFEGIIAHATYKISSGKMEGINNKIKVLRAITSIRSSAA
jgi:hypothetical protein